MHMGLGDWLWAEQEHNFGDRGKEGRCNIMSEFIGRENEI